MEDQFIATQTVLVSHTLSSFQWSKVRLADFRWNEWNLHSRRFCNLARALASMLDRRRFDTRLCITCDPRSGHGHNITSIPPLTTFHQRSFPRILSSGPKFSFHKGPLQFNSRIDDLRRLPRRSKFRFDPSTNRTYISRCQSSSHAHSLLSRGRAAPGWTLLEIHRRSGNYVWHTVLLLTPSTSAWR